MKYFLRRFTGGEVRNFMGESETPKSETPKLETPEPVESELPEAPIPSDADTPGVREAEEGDRRGSGWT